MMLSQENLQLLQGVSIFRDLEPDTALSRLAEAIEPKQFPANHTIIQQGEASTVLYILATGQVKVHLGNCQLAQLGTGAYFGEISLFDSQPASASVSTLEPCQCLILSQAQLIQTIQEHPDVGLHILRVLAQRIRQLNTYVSVWLRGLLTVAWVDGQFQADEQALIESLVHQELVPHARLGSLSPISGSELAAVLGSNPSLAENFLRAALIVALANGTYSEAEDQLLRDFCQALRQKQSMLDALKNALLPDSMPSPVASPLHSIQMEAAHLDLLQPVRHWLDDLEIDTPYLARFLCKLIPAQCPFERDIVLFGRKVIHIPPMCKLNPLYEQLVGLRFRALCYLADVCQEDISAYL
jgi:CRP-like cAMP-binding protein